MPCSGPSEPTEQEILDLYLKVRLAIYKRIPSLLDYPHPLFVDSRRKLEEQIKDVCKEVLLQAACENW